MLGFRPDLGLLDGSGSLPIPFGPYRALAALSARPDRVQIGSRGAARRPIFDRGLVGCTCIVLGRILGSLLA